MLARVAGNFYWLSRYLERIEGTARLINVHSHLLLDLPNAEPQSAWMPLVSIAGMDEVFRKHYDKATEANVTYFLIADERNHSSIINAAMAVKENLRSSRGSMPIRLYEGINNLCLMVRSELATGISPGKRQRFLESVEYQLLAITGTLEGSMSHDFGYQFLRIGNFLERADMTSRVLDVGSASLLAKNNTTQLSPFDSRQWVSVLRSLAAFQMYLQHVGKPINGRDVLAYLLQDSDLPRAYQFCLEGLDSCLQDLPDAETATTLLQDLQHDIESVDITLLANQQTELHQFIDELQIKLALVGNAIADRYFPSTED